MKEFWDKNKFSTTIILFVLLIFPATYFSARFLIGKIGDTSDKIQEISADVELEKSKIDSISDMEKIVKEIDANGNTLDVVIDDSEEVNFIKSLESLADVTGNKIKIAVNDDKNLPVQKPVAAINGKQVEKSIADNLAHKKSITLDISLDGNYENLVNFIHKLENGKYYADIVSIDSRKSSVKSDSTVSSSGGIFVNSAAPTVNPNNVNNPNSANPSSGTQTNNVETIQTKLEIVVYLK